MAQRYTEDLKMAIVRSHIEDGRTLTSLSKEYNLNYSSSIKCSHKSQFKDVLL